MNDEDAAQLRDATTLALDDGAPIVRRDADGTLTVEYHPDHPTRVYQVHESVINLWVGYVNAATRDLVQLQEAARALVSLVRMEYPAEYTLSEIAVTWGEGITPEQVEALRVLDSAVPSEQARP